MNNSLTLRPSRNCWHSKFTFRVLIALSSAVAFGPSTAEARTVDVSPFYVFAFVPFDPFGSGLPMAPVPNGWLPEIHVVGGGIDPPVDNRGRYSIARFIDVTTYGGLPSGYSVLAFSSPVTGPCGTAMQVPQPPRSSASLSATRYFRADVPVNGCRLDSGATAATAKWTTTDTITLQAPVRRAAIDGSEYDASPMVQLRNGVPWMTYYFGYRLGLVASQSNWLDSNLPRVMPALTGWPAFPNSRDNFELTKLPAPYIEGEIVEYVNFQVSPGSSAGHYFYATGSAEQAQLDGVESWARTGKSFKSGGYVSVCRLFAAGTDGKSGTHFYSADATECNQLKGLSFLQYEGEVFRASRPIPATSATASATCPLGTVGLYRFYNNAAGKSYANNHRYLIGRPYPSEGSAMVSVGWTDEGLQMCVPDAP